MRATTVPGHVTAAHHGPMTADPTPSALPRCALCGDVIGVYEPAVAVTGGGSVTTSWLQLEDPTSVDALYHRSCHDAQARGTV
jgi:hypothetical protein